VNPDRLKNCGKTPLSLTSQGRHGEVVKLFETGVRNGLGPLAAPRGNCQEDWTGPDDDFHSVPSWDILGLQV